MVHPSSSKVGGLEGRLTPSGPRLAATACTRRMSPSTSRLGCFPKTARAAASVSWGEGEEGYQRIAGRSGWRHAIASTSTRVARLRA